MMRALIGHTGFVGGNLLRQLPFDELFNSRNIEEISGRRFEEVVCAGVPAEKWRANAEPEKDWESISRLIRTLSTVQARRFILISTVDVYPSPVGLDETAPIDPTAGAAYGRHRLLLERFVTERFTGTVLRLPGLFGPGLKKNAIYDLLHSHEVDRIDGRGIFQFYNIARLGRDILEASANAIGVLNVTTSPIPIREIARSLFGVELRDGEGESAPCYDVRSRYDGLWGGSRGYLYLRDDIMSELASFVNQHLAGRRLIGE